MIQTNKKKQQQQYFYLCVYVLAVISTAMIFYTGMILLFDNTFMNDYKPIIVTGMLVIGVFGFILSVIYVILQIDEILS